MGGVCSRSRVTDGSILKLYQFLAEFLQPEGAESGATVSIQSQIGVEGYNAIDMAMNVNKIYTYNIITPAKQIERGHLE